MLTAGPTTASVRRVGGPIRSSPSAAAPSTKRASSAARETPPARAVVVTGLSGAGKTLALKSLEDMGYEAVDNLPLSLLDPLLRPGELRRPVAIGIDIRTRDFGPDSMLARLRRLMESRVADLRLLFVECDDEILRRRFTESRRRHPLAADRPLIDGIRYERELVAPLRERADVVVDTSDLPPAEFRRVLAGHFGLEPRPLPAVFVTSFSYRRGLPREADLVFDARFLANPHYDESLRARTGLAREVVDFVAADAGFAGFMEAIASLLAPLLPRFAAEGKSYLTVAVGCTGGRHRSVVVAERLATWLRGRGLAVDLRHRDIEDGESP